jgi:transketolase
MISSQELARRIRIHALRMTAAAKSSHIGSALSCADLLAVLYTNHLRITPEMPQDPQRDRFLVSKGHVAAIVYAVLAERGFFPLSRLTEYCKDGSELLGHVEHRIPGVEISTGSLGHGLSVGCGLALAAQRDWLMRRTFVLVSDGELNEGSNWEAVLFASHHRLDSLTLLIDANGLQGLDSIDRVLTLEPLAAKFGAFGWSARELDGHDHSRISQALGEIPWEAGKPNVLIARTTKGKGVSFMENSIQWHYKSANPDELSAALAELEAS